MLEAVKFYEKSQRDQKKYMVMTALHVRGWEDNDFFQLQEDFQVIKSRFVNGLIQCFSGRGLFFDQNDDQYNVYLESGVYIIKHNDTIKAVAPDLPSAIVYVCDQMTTWPFGDSNELHSTDH